MSSLLVISRLLTTVCSTFSSSPAGGMSPARPLRPMTVFSGMRSKARLPSSGLASVPETPGAFAAAFARVLFRRNVKDERANFSQKFALQECEIVVLAIEVALVRINFVGKARGRELHTYRAEPAKDFIF